MCVCVSDRIKIKKVYICARLYDSGHSKSVCFHCTVHLCGAIKQIFMVNFKVLNV